jgi:hypothetical protein
MEKWKTLFDEDLDARADSSSPPATALRKMSSRRYKQQSVSTASLEASRRFEELNEQSRRYFRLSVTTGWKKLNDYYTKLGDSPLYTAAIILHPGFGLSWLEEHWTGEQIY